MMRQITFILYRSRSSQAQNKRQGWPVIAYTSDKTKLWRNYLFIVLCCLLRVLLPASGRHRGAICRMGI